MFIKSITKTCTYGRSRKTNQQVSEGNVAISNIMSLNNNVAVFPTEYSCSKNTRECKIDLGERIRAISSLTTEHEGLGSDFDYNGPVKNTSFIPQSSRNIIRPNQKPLTIIRKPGRPAKVRISGISVTINRTSPEEREVTIISFLPPYQ